MSDERKYYPQPNPPPGSEPSRVPPRTWIVWIAIIGVIVGITLRSRQSGPHSAPLSPFAFQQKIDSNLIASASMSYDAQSAGVVHIQGAYYQTDGDGKPLKDLQPIPFHTEDVATEKLLNQLRTVPSFEVRQNQPGSSYMNLFWTVLPFLVIGFFIWVFFLRRPPRPPHPPQSPQ
jgi:hypothetical protein